MRRKKKSHLSAGPLDAGTRHTTAQCLGKQQQMATEHGNATFGLPHPVQGASARMHPCNGATVQMVIPMHTHTPIHNGRHIHSRVLAGSQCKASANLCAITDYAIGHGNVAESIRHRSSPPRWNLCSFPFPRTPHLLLQDFSHPEHVPYG